MGPIVFLLAGFWGWMLFDCFRHEPDRGTWLLIIFFLNVPGAILYCVVRRSPYMNIQLPSQLRRWTHRKKIWDAEAAAKHIGKSYQYIDLGNVLLDAGMSDRAFEAFQQAIDQDPKNPNALWGIASIEAMGKDYTAAKEHLTTLMQVDPDHKFGEGSLAYAQVLYELHDWELAVPHLVDDLKRWSHPESAIMLATIYGDQGKTDAARDVLDTMMFKLKGTPHFYFRKKRHLLSQARKLLRRLGS